jgi:hypothetical protein
MDLWSTKDFTQVVREWNRSLSSNQTNTITFLKFDIKNQFTNLNKKEIIQELVEILDELKAARGIDTIAIAKRRIEKKRDHIGKANRRDFYTVTHQDIINYTILELENSYFQVGKTTYFQKSGLPMGGLLSAGLAVLDAMYKERKYITTWKHNPIAHVYWKRFRDDIFGIATSNVNSGDILKLKDVLQKVYGKDLEVVLEDYSNSKSNFLDYHLTWNNGKINLWDNNKISDLTGLFETKRIVRYPHFTAELNKQVFIGLMIGGLKRASNNSNSDAAKCLSTLQKIIEWKDKQYPIQWITKALFIARIPNPKWYKSLLKTFSTTATAQDKCLLALPRACN